MTELRAGNQDEVRAGADGGPAAVRIGGRWRPVTETFNRWVVDTDWWRTPVRREYRRCLVAGGECLELCRELDSPGWRVVRRYD
jgi:hypothetical protein